MRRNGSATITYAPSRRDFPLNLIPRVEKRFPDEESADGHFQGQHVQLYAGSLLLLSVCVVAVFMLDFDLRESPEVVVERAKIIKTDKKAKIHTYFEKEFHSEVMVRDWEIFWKSVGFETTILTKQNALNHPAWEELSQKLYGKVDEHAYHYYLRYLAMANVLDGGWLSNIDVLPFNTDSMVGLPNDGKLTCHDGYAPSLISGSHNDWNKLASEAIRNAVNPSDLNVFRNINKDLYLIEKNILHASQLFSEIFHYSNWCQEQSHTLAIRIVNLDLPKDVSLNMIEFHNLVKQWLNLFKARCQTRRPLIYTFFEPLPGDMIEHHKQLEAWKDIWRMAGWEPFVLNLYDAKRHSRYSDFHRLMLSNQTKSVERLKHAYCFLRWLAVSASGGGVMADYDIIPLQLLSPSQTQNQIIPKNDIFTVHARAVPCLVSGSIKEWDRMIHILYENLISNWNKNETDFHWNDMMTLQHIKKQNVFVYKEDVINLRTLYLEEISQNKTINKVIDPSKCLLTNNLLALHFSPYDTRILGFSGSLIQEQNILMMQWYQAWKYACLPNLQGRSKLPKYIERQDLISITKNTLPQISHN